jgi:TrmH family RNA methyltransferase
LQTLTLGKHNPKLVELRKAIDHGTLTPDGLLAVEGPTLIEEACGSGLRIVEVFLRKGFPLSSIALPPDASLYEIEPSVFKSIQGTETSQGVVALVQPREFSINEILQRHNPLIVMLSQLQDPGNVGTILRVAEAFDASGCVATRNTVSIYNAKVVRASAGSVFRFPCVWGVESEQALSRMRAAGITIVGTSPLGDDSIETWDWRRPSAILIGNEGGGLTAEEMDMCDTVLRIPQNTAVESLNSAVAASIILYEASRHRRTS